MNFAERVKNLVSEMTLAEKTSQLVFDAMPISRLGIKGYNWWNEALHGVARSGTATVFPQAIALAASFNKNLMFKVGAAISDEGRAKYNQYKKSGSTDIYEGLTFWSPNINIFRDPRWGRGHETYGEDPYLTGEMACAFVKGIQGDDPVFKKADATLKHFAVHSGPEGKRHGFDVKIDKKELYETYLAAFKYCIDNANPSAVMGAYNSVNGEPCCASKTLIQDILRNEFGFKGYFVSDCGAICDINQFHKLTKNEAESAALAVNAGCDLNCGSAYKFLKAAVAQGLVSEERITESVEKLFEARFKLGMFDETKFDDIPYSVLCSKENTELASEMSRQSIVLLENKNILPLDAEKLKTVAVIGPNADNVNVLLGNYNGTPLKKSTLLEGIQNIDGNFDVLYSVGCDHVKDTSAVAWAPKPEKEALICASLSDVVILCLGLNPQIEGEEGDAYNSDMSGDKPSINLPDIQINLYNKIKAIGKPIVVVNVSGSCVNLSFAKNADAIVQCFYPGQDGGNALADILFGKTSPSGRLPVTFYACDDDLPAFEDYSMRGRTYRYINKKPLYPFGYGKSYTNFEYFINEYYEDEDYGYLNFSIKNTGEYAAYDVPQIYIKHPEAPVTTPLLQLVAFEKVFIDKKDCKNILIKIPKNRFMVYNDDGNTFSYKGNAKLILASSAEDEKAFVNIKLKAL